MFETTHTLDPKTIKILVPNFGCLLKSSLGEKLVFSVAFGLPGIQINKKGHIPRLKKSESCQLESRIKSLAIFPGGFMGNKLGRSGWGILTV